MSKRNLVDIEATETVPLADCPWLESTFDTLQASCVAVARHEGANVLPWRGNARACLDLRGLDGGGDAGSKRLSNITEHAAVALMRLGIARVALFGFDPDHCLQPVIAPVRLRGTGAPAHLDQPIQSMLRLPLGSPEPVRGFL
jgi:hypothetical protein